MSGDRNLPYIPKQVVFHEHTIRPELYNDHNNRLERIIGEMKEVILDTVAMKNIVMGEVQKMGEVNDKNNYSVHLRIDEMMAKLDKLESTNNTNFEQINKILVEIKDRLIMYEVEPDFDEPELSME